MMELEPRVAILQDLRLQTFDSIRFASYRTASKLRYIQKSTNLHLVDIWNVIEAFRENGLNTLEPQNEVSVARLETLVSSLYHNLNKRLPTAQQVPVDSKAGLLLNWLLAAYTSDNSGKIRVFSIKVALATMCSGKLVDKLRYIFSQISDGAGQLVPWKLGEFLREVLALPAAVYESPTFHYKEGLEEEIFPAENKVTVNDFMAILMSEPGPSCLVWLPLLHRLATVETIVHPTICSVCHKENFTGFRYRCQRCHAYQLCQECFWHGKTSLNHQNDHEVKEYSSYKSPSKQIGHSLRKSFRCVPEKTAQVLPRFPEQPEKTLNLSHIVPPSPLPSHNGFSDPSTMLHGGGGIPGGIYDRSSTLDSRATGRSLDSACGASVSRVAASANDEEHRLIARYAARLAQENRAPCNMANDNSTITDSSRAQRELIAQLETKNKEIMREISRLRRQQEAEQMTPENPALINELRALRQRKGELEGHLGALQDSRRQLMDQLEGLMRMLKNQQTSSPRSTPNSSPRSGKSPPMPSGGVSGAGQGMANSIVSSMNSIHSQQQQQLMGNVLRSTQQQMQQSNSQQQQIPPNCQSQSLMQQQQQHQQHQQQQLNANQLEALAMNHLNEVRAAFNGSSNGTRTINRNARNDLHSAADSITSAMSTLVHDLNTGYNMIDEPVFVKPLEWQEVFEDEELLLEEIRSLNPRSRNAEQNENEEMRIAENMTFNNDVDSEEEISRRIYLRYLSNLNIDENDDDDDGDGVDGGTDADADRIFNRNINDYDDEYEEMISNSYPRLVDDENAGFPAIHEIDFDESQSYNNEWNEKTNANSQWQEQFAQWNLNTQN